jgi:hypothetical protein
VLGLLSAPLGLRAGTPPFKANLDIRNHRALQGCQGGQNALRERVHKEARSRPAERTAGWPSRASGARVHPFEVVLLQASNGWSQLAFGFGIAGWQSAAYFPASVIDGYAFQHGA